MKYSVHFGQLFYGITIHVCYVPKEDFKILVVQFFLQLFLRKYRASDISRKKNKISRDFQGQIRGKIGRFRGIFAGKKSKFAAQSADFGRFSWERSQNSRKIGPFRGILAEKSQFSKDFQGQVLRKIGRFHGKFRGETSPRNNQ